MSIVTLTDHDSIEGSEPLRRYPDFFLSEEVTVRMPSGTETHLGVYAITERNHVEIQRRRNDLIPLLIYSDRAKAVLQREHVFSGLTGREAEDFQWFASYVPAFETRNGQMQVEANASAARLAARLEKIGIAGSDSHTMAGAGRTYTEVSGLRTVDEFSASCEKGRRMNRWRAPRWFRIWMIAATRIGDGWIWYGLGLTLLLFGGPTTIFGAWCRWIGGHLRYLRIQSAEEA